MKSPGVAARNNEGHNRENWKEKSVAQALSAKESTGFVLLTVDVEDWFQVENFKRCIPSSSWPNCELRVEKNTHRLLELLDSHHGPRTTDHGPGVKPRATFFILGWLAERLPHLIHEIHTRGHEVASHGYYHNLCNEQSPNALKKDLSDSKKLLEDIIGAPVYGYRAPSFAINEDILKVIQGCGYLYDSSYNSFRMHGRYGRVDLSQNGTRGIALQIPKTQCPLSSIQHSASSIQYQSSILYELPISNLKLGNRTVAWGGGGYFRLMPYPLFEIGVKSILRKQGAYLFYMHPWELDPEQPRVENAPRFFKFRHYVNLDKMASKLSSFLEAFKQCHFVTCSEYLHKDTENPVE